MIDFVVEVDRTNCWRWELWFVDFAAVELAGCSAQKYHQRYLTVAVVGSDFDLMVGH